MTTTKDLSKHHTIHNLAVLLKDFRHITLVLGLGLWVVCPLVGVVILLIQAQINVSTNRLEGHKGSLSNIFLITLVLFTITTYVASFEPFNGVAESRYECQLCTYPKVSLSLGFKNLIKQDSYLKSATPYILWLAISLLQIFKYSLETILSAIGSIINSSQKTETSIKWQWTKGQIDGLFAILTVRDQTRNAWVGLFKSW